MDINAIKKTLGNPDIDNIKEKDGLVLIGISLEICSTVAQGISYSVIVWCTQKVVGQEVIHKALKKRVEKS